MAMTKPTILLLALATVWSAGGIAHGHPQEPCDPVYRLYRNWAPCVERTGHMHIATFDSCETDEDPRPGTTYNRTMCEFARQLFQSQPGVTVTFWCEGEGR